MATRRTRLALQNPGLLSSYSYLPALSPSEPDGCDLSWEGRADEGLPLKPGSALMCGSCQGPLSWANLSYPPQTLQTLPSQSVC